MTRYVYVVESVGEESSVICVCSTPGKAVFELRKNTGVSLRRGSVSSLRSGEFVWAESKGGDYLGCASKRKLL
jgi:hypothetical protein